MSERAAFDREIMACFNLEGNGNMRIAHLELHLAEPGSGEWLFDRLGGDRFGEKGILRQIDFKGSFDTFRLLIYFGQDDHSGDLDIVDDGLLIEGQMGHTLVGGFTDLRVEAETFGGGDRAGKSDLPCPELHRSAGRDFVG